MDITTLSSKGQIIIPKGVREAHGWEAGVQFTVEDQGDSLVLRPIKGFTASTVSEVVGCTGYHGPRRSLKDMEQAIGRGVQGST